MSSESDDPLPSSGGDAGAGAAGAGGARRRVLIVDDEEDIRDALGAVFAMEGFDVTLAESAARALDQARDTAFDLVLTDLRMPGMGGAEMLTQLVKIDPGVPIIVITGYVSDETAQDCLRRGARDCLRKPFALDALLATVTRVLA